MKTILSRLKTLVQNEIVAGGDLSYVKDVEVVHPEVALTLLTIGSLPKVLFTPVSSSEEWVASGRKQVNNTVGAYLILHYGQREANVMGDSSRPAGQGKGILDFVADFVSVVRSHRLAVDGTNYLDKPIDVSGVDYSVEELQGGPAGDLRLLVASVELQATRLIEQVSLPGNI